MHGWIMNAHLATLQRYCQPLLNLESTIAGDTMIKIAYSINPAKNTGYSTVVNDQASVWEPLHDIILYCSLKVLAPFKSGRWCFDVIRVNRQPRLSVVLDHLRKPSVHSESYCTLTYTYTHTHTHKQYTSSTEREVLGDIFYQ